MNSLNSVAYNINEKIFDHCVNTMNNISDVKKRLRHDTLKLAGERTKMLSAPD
jgi:hypothetical protein